MDFVAKPEPDLINSLGDYAEEIITKVKVAASARVDCLGPAMRSSSPASEEVVSRIDHLPGGGQISLVAIGASTGGTEAIHEVLRTMPKDSPAIVITQHIPENFSLTFARRMDEISEMTVTEAEDGEQIKPGHAYIAPGNRHLRVMKQGNNLYCKVMDGPPVNRHRPSVDVLFNSVAESVGSGAVGVILTGMGKDGARGLLAIKSAGGVTIAQDEKTSVVWGMPGAAVGLECVDEVLPLPDIGVLVRTLSQRQNRKTG